MGGLGGIDDTTTGYAALVGAASICPGRVRVVPGDPDSSYLVEKLEQASFECGGSQMPTVGEMTAEELATIRSWILGGALND